MLKFPLLLPVTGLLVPGLWYPDIGLPEFDIGLIICEIPPGCYCAEVNGRENDVPGRGALLIALSSIND